MAGGDLSSYETGGLFSATTPKTTRCRADAVKVAEEFTVTAETASPLVDFYKEKGKISPFGAQKVLLCPGQGYPFNTSLLLSLFTITRGACHHISFPFKKKIIST